MFGSGEIALIDKVMRQFNHLSMTLSQKWVPLLRVML
jgi:hypothetical protein